jgi:hypothetical protein
MTVIQKLFLIIISITMIIGIATATETNLDSGLVAQYLFNGNANDNTGHGHDGTVYGPIMAPDRFGNPDGAYYFDGLDDYIEVPDDPELKPQSVSLVIWVNIDPAGSQNSKAGSDGYIIFKRNVLTANFEGYQISASPSQIHGTVSSTSGTQVSVYLPSMPGEWHQIAMTADSQNIKMYLDGEFVSEKPTGFPLNYAADNLYFGNSQEWFYKYYHGLIDEISIYNRILSADEIRSLYSNPVPPTNQPPILDEIGSQIIDEGQLLTFLVSATDPDPGSILTYFTTNLPIGASFDTSIRTFMWTPTFTQAGTYTVTFTVSDGTTTDSEDVVITVNEVKPPWASTCDCLPQPLIEKCFGGIGSQCEGVKIPKLVNLPFHQDKKTCTVKGYMSVGSILHDQCCIRTNNMGYMCAIGTTGECYAEWQQAVSDVKCDRYWDKEFGPYFLGGNGDNYNYLVWNLKAKSGARIGACSDFPNYKDSCLKLCPTGCKTDANGNIMIFDDTNKKCNCNQYAICE